MQQPLLLDARRIVATPHPDDNPSLRLLAWLVLKEERGQPILQSKLNAATKPVRA